MCDRQTVSVTYSLSLSQIICVGHKKSVSVKSCVRLVLNMTRFAMNMKKIGLNLTGRVLNMSGFVPNTTAFVQTMTGVHLKK